MNYDRHMERLQDIENAKAERKAGIVDLLANEWALKHSNHANLVQTVHDGNEDLLIDLALIYGVIARHPTQGKSFDSELMAAIATINARIDGRVEDAASDLMRY